MWGSIENLKENLNKIALDVHDEDDEELEIYNSPAQNGTLVADRRTSNRFARSSPASRSPLANGFDSPHKSEVEQYKAEIRRLKESEAEIKALSMNYAALLKEKEDQILKLNGENAALNALRNESFKASTSSPNGLKGSSDLSPSRHHKASMKSRIAGNQTNNGFVPKQDGLANGFHQQDASHSKGEPRLSSTEDNEKDLADLLEEKSRYLAAIEDQQLQIKKSGLELEKEREKLSNLQLQLQGEQKLNKSFQEELNLLKKNENKITAEMNQMRDELNEKSTEVRRLQMMLNRTENAGKDNSMELMTQSIAALEKENTSLKMEKVELEAALKSLRPPSDNSNEKIDSLRSSPGRKDMELSLQKLEKELKEALQQKDKKIQELNRLKKHLLDKESEESEKMDEDSKVIEQLRETSEYQRLQIVHLEKALKQAIASQDEVKMTNSNEFQKYKETIDDLNRKLASCTRTIDAKNLELLNLQTALGQYYAEIEAKEHLEGDLARAREESAKLSELLKDAHQQAELLRRDKEDIVAKLSQTERTLAESRGRVNKLEEDNSKLRRALEQSMSRLNRMSMDSDYFVDRRIVIKLLVTYFQRNHSKEVLELMVRMLGFSDEDKKRIGVAQQGAGKGIVRGVLGMPGRLVGGFLGSGSAEPSTHMASENQSFADLWVDFLLTETEARERRESEETTTSSPAADQKQTSPYPIGPASPVPAASPPVSSSRLNPAAASAFSQYSSPLSSSREHSDSEFSTVPLNSSERTSQATRSFPRY